MIRRKQFILNWMVVRILPIRSALNLFSNQFWTVTFTFSKYISGRDTTPQD
jgi:hypothetical protein